MYWQPFGGMCWVSSRKNQITGKVSVLPLKNSLWEVKETAVASPCRSALCRPAWQSPLCGDCTFSSMPIFFGDRGGRAMYLDRASRARVGKAGVLPVAEAGGQMRIGQLFLQDGAATPRHRRSGEGRSTVRNGGTAAGEGPAVAAGARR